MSEVPFAFVAPDTDPLARARELAPRIRERADEIEAARKLPEDLPRLLAAAGFDRSWAPRECGGSAEERPGRPAHALVARARRQRP